MNGHRKKWVKHNGPIPVDDQGRSYEIHHIDNNPRNNKLDNLMCVSLEEHYQIHKDQGDYLACRLIAERLNKTPEEISELARAGAKKRVAEGTHNFLGGIPRPDMLGDNNPMRNPAIAKKQADARRGWNPSAETRARMSKAWEKKKNYECDYCGIKTSKTNIVRWHNEKCKERTHLR